MSYPLKCPKCGENVVERISDQTVTEKGYIDSEGDFVFTESVAEEMIEVKYLRCRICSSVHIPGE